jgi:uncharacterized protein (TIGR03546 family)
MLKIIAKLLAVLNSETDPAQISLAFCFAVITGFTPLLSLHNLFVLFIILILRVNLSAFILGTTFLSGIAYLLDSIFHEIGLAALKADFLKGVWTALYNNTIFRMENFNNSIVMGSLVVSLLLFLPLFFLSNILIRRYRSNLLSWVEKTKIMQIFKAGKLYSLYKAVA